MQMLACLSCKDCPPPLIDSTTGHYNGTGTHSTSLSLAFLTSVQQGRAPEHSFVMLWCSHLEGFHCTYLVQVPYHHVHHSTEMNTNYSDTPRTLCMAMKVARLGISKSDTPLVTMLMSRKGKGQSNVVGRLLCLLKLLPTLHLTISHH